MKGFIEVERKSDRSKSLIAISSIERVDETNSGRNAEIIQHSHKKIGYGLTTHETYAEVVEKIKKAVE